MMNYSAYDVPRICVQLTSSKNPLLKDIRRAIFKGALTADGHCIAETFHLLEEAIRSECLIKAVVCSESVKTTVEQRVRGIAGLELITVADALFGQISATETSQGVIALVRPPVWNLDHIFRGHPLVVLLDGLQDPGNAGAIFRAAEAFGASGAICLKGSVNPYNPKALRASAGSVFRLPLIAGLDEQFALAAIAQRRVDLYAAMPRAHHTLDSLDFTRSCAFIIGGEGRGVSARLQAASISLRIPTSHVESLNAAVAAGVLLYEAWRQRKPL